MLVGHLDTEKSVLILEYPKRAHLPRKCLPVKNLDHAISIWNIQARKYIFETLRGFVLQRSKAIFLMNGSKRTRCSNAVDKLLLMLMGGYESPLDRLCAKVKRDAHLIKELEPGPFSRFRHHYAEVIVPIVEWCSQYLDDMAELPTHN